MRRAAAAIAVFFAFHAAASAAGSVHSWAQPQIKLVTRHGIFAGTPATFDASSPLTERTLAAGRSRVEVRVRPHFDIVVSELFGPLAAARADGRAGFAHAS